MGIVTIVYISSVSLTQIFHFIHGQFLKDFLEQFRKKYAYEKISAFQQINVSQKTVL